MPIYEYRCVRCGHQFDVTHAVGKTRARCEKCGGAVRRVFTSVGIIFKGSGFHVNDYRKTPAPADGEGKAKSGDAAKTGDKTASGGEAATAGAAGGSGSSKKSGKDRSATAPSQGAGTKSS